MSDPREAITANLTAHGVRLDAVGRSTADLSEILSSMDYAAVLGMIPAKDAAMLLAKYADDELEERKIRVWWRTELVDVGWVKGWKGGWRLERMADSTMSEHMGQDTRCMVCNGTRERIINKLPVVCPGCSGAGFLQYTPEHLALEIGITMLEWDKAWRTRVDWCRRRLFQWEQGAAELFWDRFRDDG